MPSIFVVSSADAVYAERCRAVLGFRNVMTSSTVTASSEDPTYPKELMYDYKSNTEYSPAITSGSTVINIYTSSQTINYVGVFSKNAGDCGLSFKVEVFNVVTGLYLDLGTYGSMTNAVPRMVSFDPITSTAQRITFYFTSKCYIAAMHVGEAIVFSRAPSLGYQPGRNSTLDEVSQFTTDGANFTQGRRIGNGFQEKGVIRFQRYEDLDVWFREYMNHVYDSKPIFWLPNNQLNNAVYGLQVPDRLQKLDYKTRHLTDFEFEINCFA